MKLELTDTQAMTLLIILGEVKVAKVPTDEDAVNIKVIHKMLKAEVLNR